MGLETDITDIQSLNQNWPPVSDPRAQGADHIRNIKKAIQLTFPNLKQCLLNDAQFTALGTLVGDGSGTFTINGKLTVSDSLTVPAVNDWASQQAVGAKDAEGRYLKPGDADGRYLKPGDADGRYVRSPLNSSVDSRITYIGVNKETGQPYALPDAGTIIWLQIAGDYATNPALNTETTNRTNADTDLQNQINNRVLKTGDTTAWLQVTGNLWALGNNLSVYNKSANVWCNTYVDNSGAATWDLNGGTPGAPTGNKSWLRMYADGTLRTGRDAVAFQSDLPRTFISAQQGVQTNYRYVIPHNLGRVPDAFWVYLVNVSSDWGYNPGQMAIPSFDDKNNGGFGPLPVNADRWNIFLPMSDAVPLVSRMDPSNGDKQLGDRQSIYADRWRFVFYAVCMRG